MDMLERCARGMNQQEGMQFFNIVVRDRASREAKY